MTPEQQRDATNTELRRRIAQQRIEILELERSLTKSRQIIAQLRSSPWTYMPLYTMDTVHKVADQ